MLDYPMRDAKALRPGLCIAVCRALGGRLEDALPTATALELYHNAFLIHDDIEDGSLLRRGRPTLHLLHGAPVAVNVGDAMLALSLQPLLDNTERLGLGPALRILQVVSRMARESAEGQAVELDWIRHDTWDLEDRDYLRMVYQKTCWYTFIAPSLLGSLAAGASEAQRWTLTRFAVLLGMAFQIQDDVLNLASEEAVYGKEANGDLWEGKRTLILLHALRHAEPSERARAKDLLRLPRASKTEEGVSYLRALVDRRDSLGHARAVATRRAERARRTLESARGWLKPSVHQGFLTALVDYVMDRTR
ncbi:MAG: polyprenyl synthetase family protein [Deltaproteobacteria bacterium]|nr:polyprenyl synthetase family protein [Deltaproteobacteria bacterium]